MATGNGRNATNNSGDKSRFRFKTEMHSVSGQTNANKTVVGTAAPMLRNGKIADLSIYSEFTGCKRRGTRHLESWGFTLPSGTVSSKIPSRDFFTESTPSPNT